MKALLLRFWRDERGGPAAEFALVAPILVLFLLGIIDVGRLMWEWNQAEKATQAGARFAVATDPVPGGNNPSSLKNYSFAASPPYISQGEKVETDDFGSITCDGSKSTCTCTTCPGGMIVTLDSTIFGKLVDRIKTFKPDVTTANVIVDYSNSGLGFAGDPNGPDVAPLITVRLLGLKFQPIFLFGMVELDLPDFAATLTMEDAEGDKSN